MGVHKGKEEEALEAIVDALIASGPVTREQLGRLKIKYAKQFGLKEITTNAAILARIPEDERDLLLPVLKRRSKRTMSGVSIIAAMTRPMPCPGKCLYCPGRESQPDQPVAKSYTGREPAALRSLMYGYDPFKQVASRVHDLESIGHACDKIELIVMGGTFLSTPKDFQESFVKGCIDGVLGKVTSSLLEAKRLAETSDRRIIGITFETRPDFCMGEHVDAMLDYGGTRVEIGVQTTRDAIYQLVERGHDASATKMAVQSARDAGLKICFHLMPNMPGSSVDQDKAMFDEIFADGAYRPDYLKIYPCLVVSGTTLEKWWRDGKYTPYSTAELVQLLAIVKSRLPAWVRIQRVQRDIPADLILEGVKNSNLRELVWQYMDKNGLKCNCIRCKEYGFSREHRSITPIPDVDDLDIQTEFYQASGGMECFISARHPGTAEIFGYVRLRKPSAAAHRPEINGSPSSIIRELRVVGEVVPVSKVAKQLQAQHRGLGKKLVQLAEHVARTDFSSTKLLVIAGIGVRPYFYNLGFEQDGPYVSKRI
ncbi:MAG: tRNA uridine(34) 5-carboxymethylaminomethyl modification radical SAM/GNAT enzyme Elp3 [Candidatus Lokiarchaeota archaeon]|nr:tRNA uridine(34) 5-carboxymethylaminomethyl modification radical SAM/GNAT enzyme Elp3 [Candidatus Lokiarchaeota archaeon]